MNLFHYLSSTVQRYPDKNALIYKDRRVTYRQMHEHICSLAGALHKMGIGHGSQIGLICHNSDAYIEIFFAAAKLGAVSEHFCWRLHVDNMIQQVEMSDASVIFISDKDIRFYHALKSRLERPVRYVIVGDFECDEVRFEDLIQSKCSTIPTTFCAPEDPCILLYTSGTTGIGKGVVHSVNSFLIHTLVVISALDWGKETVLLNIQPLFHAAASGAYSTLLAGGTVVIEDQFEPSECLRLIETEGITRIGLVPHVIEWLIQTPNLSEYNLQSLKTIVYSGAPMAPDVLFQAYHTLKCGFIQIYGMTELCPNVAVLTPQEHLRMLESGDRTTLPVGKPILGTRIRIWDGNRDCGSGEIGEILVSSDTLMLKYYKQPELTAQMIRDGWYYTGDNGYVDEEGYLYLVGRKKHMIICGGENIYPLEVENAIRQLGDLVQDVAVIAVPNQKWGEVVKALIVKSDCANLSGEDILAHCQQFLSPYKKPRIVQFVSEIPRNDSGKLNHEAVRELYANEQGYLDRNFFKMNV